MILMLLGPSRAHTNPPGSDQVAHTNWGTLQLLSQVVLNFHTNTTINFHTNTTFNFYTNTTSCLTDIWLLFKPTLCTVVLALFVMITAVFL